MVTIYAGGTCTPCDPGSYSSTKNSTACTLCPVNFYDSTQWIVRSNFGVCTAAPDHGYSAAAGSISYSCNAGYFVEAVYSLCSACPAGKPFIYLFFYAIKANPVAQECIQMEVMPQFASAAPLATPPPQPAHTSAPASAMLVIIQPLDMQQEGGI